MIEPEVDRRLVLKLSLAGAAGAAFGCAAPAQAARDPKQPLRIGQIGCGRMAREGDIPGVLKHHDLARYVAVCDVDAKRLARAREQIERHYAKVLDEKSRPEVKTYGDHRELLARPDIDAVVITTPDHWHGRQILDAAGAGKDIYVQKPLTFTLAEGRAASDLVRARGRILQVGSQQRSAEHFRRACELVRNGRAGRLRTVRIGLPTDPTAPDSPEQPIPPNLDYRRWLGPTPHVYYTEQRVHPQKDYSRPGWLRCGQFTLGMITGWGAHHLDIAHWAMGTEETGPVELEGRAEFPDRKIWNVHGKFHVELVYADGVRMIVDDSFPVGLRFEGDEGWIFVSRGNVKVTASDPAAPAATLKALDASDPKLLAPLGEGALRLPVSGNHYRNWLESVLSRQEPVAPVETAHRSCSACILAWAAMKLGRKLRWDPVRETFPDDPEANAALGVKPTNRK